MDFPSSFPPTHFSLHNAALRADYDLWISQLRPRTCLLMHWLAGMDVVPYPAPSAHRKAQHFAAKRLLLGRILDQAGGEFAAKTQWLLDNREFDLYVTYVMWLRFNEYVPRRFVAPDGRARLLEWVRMQLGRPELTDAETIGELEWQIERIRSEMDEGTE